MPHLQVITLKIVTFLPEVLPGTQGTEKAIGMAESLSCK